MEQLQLPDLEGPAPPESPLRMYLDLLILRGCEILYVPPEKGVMEVYQCYYPDDIDGGRARCRLFYPDYRGAEQALGLLLELNTGKKVDEHTEMYTSAGTNYLVHTTRG